MNPIKTSDLFINSGELDKIIKDLERINGLTEELRQTESKKAKQLEQTIKTTGTATRQQREELEANAKQVAEIERRYNKYTESLNDNAQKIAALQNAQTEINRLNKLEAKLVASKEGSYNALSAQLSINKIRLKQLTEEERKSTKEGKDLVKQTNDITDALKRMDKEIGVNTRNVGNYQSALDALPGPLQRARQGVKELGTQFKKLLKNPIALAIAAIVAVLATLFNAFRKSQQGGDLFSEKMEQVSAIIDVVIGRAAVLAGAIIELFSGNFDAAAEKAKQAFSGVTDEINEAVAAAKQLNDLTIAIEEEQIATVKQAARLKREIKEYNKIAEDTSKGVKVRERAAKSAIQSTRELLNNEQSLLILQADRIRAELAATPEILRSREQRQKLAEAEAKIDDKATEILELQTTLQNKLNTIRQEAARKNAEQLAKEQAAKEAALRFEEESIDRLTKKLSTAQNNLELGAKRGIVAKAFGEGLAQSEQEISGYLDRLQKELATASGDEVLTITEKILGADKALKIARQFKVDLDAAINSQPLQINAQIRLLESGNEDEVKRVLDSARNQIDQFKAEYSEPTNEPRSIYDWLGLDLSKKQEEAADSAFKAAKDNLIELANLEAQLAAQSVQRSNQRINEAQRALEIETQNRNAGFAHQVETRQKELADAKKQQQKALRDQERAQRAQLAIQTIQQTSNLITGTSKILSQFNPVVAIPLIALMWGTFIAAKVRAAQLTKQQYAEGGYEIVGGGTHASGNDTYLGFQVGGKPAYAERDEGHAIFTPRMTKKYRSVIPDLVKSINKGNFEKRYTEIGKYGFDQGTLHMNNFQVNNDNRGVERRLDTMIKQNEEARYFTNGAGQLVRKYKNITTTYIG